MPAHDEMLEKIKVAVQVHSQAITIAYEEIEKLQSTCPHTHAVREYGSDTDNYDPAMNSYWCTLECPHCGKRWRVGPDHPEYRKKPAAYTPKTAEGIVDV